MEDKEILNLIEKENWRQNNFVQLIASENFASKDVLEATGSILTNKYAEGYPGKRYYGGCEYVDEVETLAIERLKKIFKAKYANVQPHSGTQANLAVYNALLKPGDKILSMSLTHGGHLTHGHHVSISGKLYESHFYGVSKETEMIDFDEVERIANEIKPKMIICGASAYSKIIDFKKFKAIAKKVDALLLADVAHIAGLIVANLHPNPLEYADIVTSTTHKTLRGARGGIILTNDQKIAELIDKSVFPGVQGGPCMNAIAGKAVAFKEADCAEFVDYQKNVINNSKLMCDFFIKNNVKIISNGTDNHLFLINTIKSFNKTGKEVEDILHQISIIVNKNSIPFDEKSPTITSGIRIGTPAMTTRGWKKAEFLIVAESILSVLKDDSLNNIKINKLIIDNLLRSTNE